MSDPKRDEWAPGQRRRWSGSDLPPFTVREMVVNSSKFKSFAIAYDGDEPEAEHWGCDDTPSELLDATPAVPAEPACPGCNRTRRQLASMGASWGSAYAKCSDCAPEEFHAVPGEPETQRAAERELLESERNRYLAHANEGWALANERTRQLTAARAEAEQLRAELETERAAHVDAVADANEKMQRLRAELAEARGRFKQSDDTLETVRDTAERYRAELAAQIGRGDKYVSRAAHAEANAERYRVALNVADDAITDAINDYRDCECPGWSPGKPDTHGSCSKRELLIALQKVRAALSGSGAAPEGGTGGTR